MQIMPKSSSNVTAPSLPDPDDRDGEMWTPRFGNSNANYYCEAIHVGPPGDRLIAAYKIHPTIWATNTYSLIGIMRDGERLTITPQQTGWRLACWCAAGTGWYQGYLTSWYTGNNQQPSLVNRNVAVGSFSQHPADASWMLFTVSVLPLPPFGASVFEEKRQQLTEQFELTDVVKANCSCATQQFHNVSADAWDGLKGLLTSQGYPIVDDAGSISDQGFTLEWVYSPAQQELAITCTKSPGWVSCSVVNWRICDYLERSGYLA